MVFELRRCGVDDKFHAFCEAAYAVHDESFQAVWNHSMIGGIELHCMDRVVWPEREYLLHSPSGELLGTAGAIDHTARFLRSRRCHLAIYRAFWPALQLEEVHDAVSASYKTGHSDPLPM